MTRKEACRILGISADAPVSEIKKSYRRLMRRMHPDSPFSSGETYPYSAWEIILAYKELKKPSAEKASGSRAPGEERKKTGQPRPDIWDAPRSEYAFCEREILHSAEDAEGNVIGNFPIARGKYLWKTEEDFPLFLLSLFRCSSRLLDAIDAALGRGTPSGRRQLQAELTYLLAQQFLDGTALLRELVPLLPDGETFLLASMLESPVPLEEGMPLYPSRLWNHRLYVKDPAGRELGYLSFRDDRLYYIVIPLFEQHRVQVKIRTAKAPSAKGRGRFPAYQNLHLWLRFAGQDPASFPESLNLQIQALLEQYRRMPA